ncbi:MAG: Gldg family protein [Lachnospiraceae bacterium]|nr:Gldg family protein [Lachnospiraceae bacterium]
MEKQDNKGTLSVFGKIGTSFHRKGFRSGVYATLTSILVIVAVVIVNLIASASGVQKDLTATGEKSLTADTKELLSGLEDELTFYYLTKEGETLTWLDPSFAMYMELYENASDKITFQTVDLLLNPKFAEKYTDRTVIQYSIIVVNETTNRSRYISSEDMVLTELTMDQYTFQYKTQVVGLDIEGQINSAIRYVTSGQQTNLYAVTGHGEWELGTEAQTLLRKANIEYNTLETMTTGKIPEDCDILFIAVPNNDYTETELELLKAYADAGGDFLILAGKQENLSNYDRLLAYCGVQLENRVIIEGNAAYHNPASQLELYPVIERGNGITDTLAGYTYLPMRNAFALKTVTDGEHEITVSPLFSTSDSAYSKKVENGQIATISKEKDDPAGPFRTGYYLKNTDTKSEAVVLSGGYIFMDSYLMISNYANAALLTNSINYLTETETVSPVRTISFDSEELLTITAAQANAIAIVFVIVIPVVLILSGIFVMLRRRNR